jgi:hypothetical protein
MLGHVELSTKQIYAQVSIRRLKTVHSLTHPGVRIDRPTPTTTQAAHEEEDAGPIPPLAAHEARRGNVDTLMATLAAETEEG